MKKTLLIAIIAILAFGGCSRMTPSVAATWAQMYDTTKTIYVKGQEVVITNADLLSEETLARLKSVDEKATRIDKTKEIITK